MLLENPAAASPDSGRLAVPTQTHPGDPTFQDLASILHPQDSFGLSLQSLNPPIFEDPSQSLSMNDGSFNHFNHEDIFSYSQTADAVDLSAYSDDCPRSTWVKRRVDVDGDASFLAAELKHAKKRKIELLLQSFKLRPIPQQRFVNAARQFVLGSLVKSYSQTEESWKHVLLQACVSFLRDKGHGDMYFPAKIDGKPTNGYTWPTDSTIIVYFLCPLFHRLVSNERQRKYAHQKRAEAKKRDSRSPSSQEQISLVEAPQNSVPSSSSSQVRVSHSGMNPEQANSENRALNHSFAERPAKLLKNSPNLSAHKESVSFCTHLSATCLHSCSICAGHSPETRIFCLQCVRFQMPGSLPCLVSQGTDNEVALGVFQPLSPVNDNIRQYLQSKIPGLDRLPASFTVQRIHKEA